MTQSIVAEVERPKSKRRMHQWEFSRWLTQSGLARYIDVSFEYVHRNKERLNIEHDLGMTVSPLDGRVRFDRLKVDRAMAIGVFNRGVA